VLKDYVVKESGKYYDIIVFEKGPSNYLIDEIYTGKNKPYSLYYEEYLLYRKKRIDKIIKQAGSLEKISPRIREENKELEKCLIRLRTH
ncbi:MAG: hypothetical protein ACOCWI_01490, partial [Bacillota bacterium]